MDKQQKFIFVLGPTASGKTDLSVRLAREFSAPLINGDSVQAYKHVNIGSAKPAAEELLGVRHFLFDCIEFPETWTAAEFTRRSQDVMAELGPLPNLIFSGGSAFYLNALEKGVSKWPVADEGQQTLIRQEILNRGDAEVWRELKELDAGLAQKISPHDHYRLVRYLEVARTLGSQASQALEETTGGLNQIGHVLKFGIYWDKTILKNRIETRLDQMLKAGWVEEVENLIAKGYEKWWPLQSVGYAEIVEFLKGTRSTQSLSDLRIQIVSSNMKLIKKQNTWWKRDSTIHWIEGTLGPERIYQAALSHLNT